MWVARAPGSSALVDLGGPGVVVAAGVGHRRDRVAQAMVPCPAKAGAFGLAGLDRDGGLAAVGGERTVAQPSEQLARGAPAAVAVAGKEAGEVLPTSADNTKDDQ